MDEIRKSIIKNKIKNFYILIFFIISIPASAVPFWVLELNDSPNNLTDEQVSELENRARAGDWGLKLEFAATYFYGEHVFYGCSQLKYGYRCKAMLKKSKAGADFLLEMLNSSPNDHSFGATIPIMQADYSKARFRAAGKFDYDPSSNACQESIYYAELAIKNGNKCAAITLEYMALLGKCIEKNQKLSRNYAAIASGCPRQ